MVPHLQESEAETEDTDDEGTDSLLEKEHRGKDPDAGQSGLFQKITLFLVGLKILFGGVRDTASKVVATLLLGLAGKKKGLSGSGHTCIFVTLRTKGLVCLGEWVKENQQHRTFISSQMACFYVQLVQLPATMYKHAHYPFS